MASKTKRSETGAALETAAPKKIVDRIASLLAADSWRFQVHEGDAHLLAHGDNGTVEVVVSCEEEAQRYFVYAYCPVIVPETHRGELAAYLVGANLPLACAKLMLAPNGRLFAETGTPLGSDGLVDGKVFGILLRLAMNVIDDRIPDVLRIVYGGATAREVLDRREQGDAPKG